MRRVLAIMVVAGCAGGTAARAQAQAAVEAGEQVFAENCAPCHGERLASPTPNTDLKKLKLADRERFEQRVLDGKPPMPPWRGALSPEEIAQIWAYIRANAYEP
jgi:cytochrome c6